MDDGFASLWMMDDLKYWTQRFRGSQSALRIFDFLFFIEDLSPVPEPVEGWFLIWNLE